MIIRRTPESLDLPIPLNLDAGSCVTIGNFDGVHLGHQALLALTRERAAQRKSPAAVVTFEPHPLEVLTPHAPPRLSTTEERLALLEAAGMDMVLLVKFTPELAAMTPEVFVRRLLTDTLNMRELFLGYDFSLGRERAGTPERLAEIGRQEGFSVDRLEALSVGEVVVSSTRIRELLRVGKPWEASALLGRLYSVRGEIIHGQKRGRLLGFPTANLAPGEVMLPKPGVYATLASLPGPSPSLLPVLKDVPRPANAAKGGKDDAARKATASFRDTGITWPAVTNIGHNPTFGPMGLSVETHLLGFQGDVYGEQMEVAFVERLRDEITFTGPDALMAQIQKDVKDADRLFTRLA